MAKLQEYNGLFCESEFECTFIAFLQDEGWEYLLGNNVKRVNKRDVLIEDDFKEFIARTNPDLEEDEITQIFDNVRLVGSESDFATLHKIYTWMVDGIQFTPKNGITRIIPLIDFEYLDDKEAYIEESVNAYTNFKVKTILYMVIYCITICIIFYLAHRLENMEDKKEELYKDDAVLFDEEENIKF